MSISIILGLEVRPFEWRRPDRYSAWVINLGIIMAVCESQAIPHHNYNIAKVLKIACHNSTWPLYITPPCNW